MPAKKRMAKSPKRAPKRPSLSDALAAVQHAKATGRWDNEGWAMLSSCEGVLRKLTGKVKQSGIH